MIRKALPEDLPEILEIESSWTTTPQWTRAHFEAELASDRSCFVVYASGGGEILSGYAALRLIPPEAQLFNIAVRKDLTSQEIGTRLMRYIFDTARSSGCETMALEVGAGNIAAQALYARFGFKIVGRRPKYYNDGSDALLMEAAL